jgi:hypothetical protein
MRLRPLAILASILLAQSLHGVPAACASSLAGYASATSVAPGDTIGFHVSSDAPVLSMRFYRQNPDPELMYEVTGLVPANVPVPDSAWVKGCGWPTLYTFNVPVDWPSGLYNVELVPPDGSLIKHIPFVLRGSPTAPRPILIISAVNTYQAYNAFGGKGLYDYNSPGGRAPKVTFNRPYDSHDGLGHPQFEVPFIRWFERAGFKADYATDVDLALDPTILAGHRLLIVPGHNEYWTKSEVNGVQAFVDSAGNAAFLGGNTCYWQVRYEDNGRTLVCYKSNADPMFFTSSEQTTVTWRDRLVRRPECIFIGVMYPYCGGTASDSLLFTHPYSWITQGLENEVGHRMGNKVVGYEFDTWFDDRSPHDAVRLFETPVADPECPQVQASTYYERQPAFDLFGRGGGIFAAGTIQWSWGLDDTENGAADPRMQLLTTNLIKGLSQPLVVKTAGMATIKARVIGPFADFGLPLRVEPVHVGPDTTSLGVFPMADDGAPPDAEAEDGIYTGQFPLIVDERMPLKLKFSSADGRQVTPLHSPDWFWLADTQFADEIYSRTLDTLSIDSDVVAVPVPAPATFRLALAPNPFTSALRLSWSAGFDVVEATVHDLRGRLIARVPVARGAHAATWDGRDARGALAPPGVYWARVRSGSDERRARVVKLR